MPTNESLWSALPVAAVLSAAANWSAYMAARRRQEDPSEQEEPDQALPALEADLDRARALVTRIQLLLSDIGSDGHLLREVGAVYQGGQLAPVLHRIHQRLLSLFPAVDDQLVEQVRLTERELDQALEGDADLTQACGACDRLLIDVARAISG